jgi:hypothetical protein
MATPADQRLLELLGRWLESLELHTKYASLDDDSYWKVQPWTEHQRPTRWIVDLAKQKTLALRAQVEQRTKANDTQFSDALELMAFPANLVGSEHIERFIPVAEASNERNLGSRADNPVENTSTQSSASITATREMPKFSGVKRAAQPPGTNQVARNERNERKPMPPPKPAPKAPGKQPPKKPGPTEEARDQVIADAVRLVQWGRKWFELPELIARMADRPGLPDVRRILKENKLAIDKKAGNA